MAICQYNEGCKCETQKCAKCGWNPDVAERRQLEILGKLGVHDKKYKIPFTGYCEVYARSPEKAMEKADRGDMDYIEYDFGNPSRVMRWREEEEEEDDELD